MKKFFVFVAMALLLVGCAKKEVRLIDAANFEKQVDGKQVSLYTLHNGNITMQVTNYGARVVALWTPDRRGNYADVTLGYDHIDKYLNNTGERYLGAVVGRCANRIGNASFTLNGTTYQLPKNDGNNTLHGGEIGTDRVVWDVLSSNDTSMVMRTILPDGQDGFPGTLDITLKYYLNSWNEFHIEYLATTDKPTLCNLSNHAFFNLAGEGKNILNHELEINGKWVLAVDENLIPNGKFVSVKKTPFDFLTPHAIGDSINSHHEQIVNGHGYDHCWIIDRKTPHKAELCASLRDPKSGRKLVVMSDQMGIQFYSGNFFNGNAVGKWGGKHLYRGAVALETQNLPDAINQENFAVKPVLNPGETYKHTCIYKFFVDELPKR